MKHPVFYLQGGLGNQMFEYAFLKYLEAAGHRGVKINASAPSLRKHSGAGVRAVFPAVEAGNRFLPVWQGHLVKWWADGLKKGLGVACMTEGMGEEQTTIPPHTVLIRGYWQEWRFAAAVEPVLRRDFVFRPDDDPRNRELAAWIEAPEQTGRTVSLHVRRGDYHDPANRAVFGDICTPEYYRRAVDFIRARVADPRFVVFSDDPAWVRGNLPLDGARYVDWNRGDASFRDMELMSRCHHHVIANSSFSWWGAWLDPRPEKIVAAPSKWFGDRPPEFVEKLLPPAWHRIEIN